MIENDNIDNDTLSIINIDHNCSIRSDEKIKENSIVSERKRRTIYKSVSLNNFMNHLLLSLS